MKIKVFKIILALCLCVPIILTGCSDNTTEVNDAPTDNIEEQKSENENEQFTIGISQLVQHPALDASRQGFVDELESQGINVEFVDQNAQGDIANAQMIAEKFVKDDVDLIFTIATLTAQAAKQSIEGTDIPMVFTAVTDPVFSQLVTDMNVTDNNITGVVDAAPIKENLELFMDIKEDIKTIGIIYNIGESNSEVQVNQTKEIAKELGLELETVGITTVNDIPQAVDTISKKAEGLYIITDNMVASSISLVAKLAGENGLLTVSADGTHVDEGILVSKGISYYAIGKQSAVIAKQILVDKTDVKDIPVQTSPEFEKKVNTKTVEILGLTKEHQAFEGAEFVGE
ncbi:ABC transporter substrate-binding protein [Sedimentibacter sp. MB31-C6]|uniref:ABC transporter substrate-binding protein n=1 Tax=Sedimentibacter sp. MB31-C6 TaxID=3109366 RepID=UPI002DDD94EC|nr:ABC transporter substrate-binding protein [Sedimentibacter sp. MB36-C1]WSI03370.1 ABC transporter substrate-binding protein [Sedimentibacter sp. MB36-C1]